MGADQVTAAGVVLAGGRSVRMGTPKAGLEWHGSTLLRRTAALLRRTLGGPVVVVAAPGQELPELPAGVDVVTDPVPGLGPVQGIATGLAAVAASTTAFVCSTDLPFLHPAYVSCLLDALDGVDAVLPVLRGHRQPLATAYRTSLAPVAAGMVAAGELRLAMLFDRCRTRRIDEAHVRADPRVAALDPELDSVVNVNEPGEYTAARARRVPEVVVRARCGELRVDAATLGAAAAAAGLTPAGPIVAVLNGTGVAWDEQLPLVAGDELTLALTYT